MTTSSIRVIYHSPADRFAARLGRALVRWADARAARAAVSHEWRSALVYNESARLERDRIARQMREFRA